MPIYDYFRYFRCTRFLLQGQLPSGNFEASPPQRVSNFRTIQIAYDNLFDGEIVIGYWDSSKFGYSLSRGCLKITGGNAQKGAY